MKFVEGYGEHLERIKNVPVGKVDLILCSSAIHWLEDLPLTLRRWRDVLRSGGKVGQGLPE